MRQALSGHRIEGRQEDGTSREGGRSPHVVRTYVECATKTPDRKEAGEFVYVSQVAYDVETQELRSRLNL